MKKGFTLVELLAVIVILAIILVIAVPKISNVIEEEKKQSLFLTAKSILRNVENNNLELNSMAKTSLASLNITNLSSDDFDLANSFAYTIDGDTFVDLKGKGKMEGLYACNVGSSTKTSNVNTASCGNLYSVTNLVTNSNFANGTTGWTLNGTVATNNGIASIVSISRYGGIHQYYTNYTSLKGHKIYSTAYLKADNYSLFWIGINDGTTQLVIPIITLDTWNKTSGIFNFSENATGAYFRTQDSRTSDWTVHYLKEPFAVDLTATFGAGNEPSKAWCDENLEYFDGTKTKYLKLN